MIYTFGRTSSYDEAFKANTPPMKVGRSEDYEGGSVWQTKTAAQAFVDSLPNESCPDWRREDFSVYGVDASWENDTYQSDPSVSWRSLKRDALLIHLYE
jgi:hypothetical protein